MMRIAYLNADCGIPVFGDKGASIHVREMVRAMAQCGADVRVVATRVGGTEGETLGVPVIHAFAKGDRDVPSGDRAAKERLNMADAALACARLIKLYEEWPFDMIYERYSLWSRAGADAASHLGVPLIVEVNAPLLREQADCRELALAEVAASIENAVFMSADAFIAVSSPLRDYIVSRGASAERVIVAGNAVDTARFHPNVQPGDFGIPAGAFTVGFSGSLKSWHGLDVMMEAFRLLRQEVPKAHLLIVGDGPGRGWIDGFVRGARLETAVTMTGWIAHDALPRALAAMDAAIAPYPKSDDFYFSPLKLYEYLAAGKPVVASDIGQISDVIVSGTNGILVPPGDPVRLAQALMALRADARLAGRLATAAATLGAQHSWTRNAQMVLALGTGGRKAA